MMVKQQSRSNLEESSWVARFIPLLGWAPQYERQSLRPDLIAGLTVTALVVPKALGYTGIASVPIQYGLYAAAAGAILYAFFGTSRQISTGPSSALAAVAASAVLAAGLWTTRSTSKWT
jgi:SulP family sulfate permease